MEFRLLGPLEPGVRRARRAADGLRDWTKLERSYGAVLNKKAPSWRGLLQ